MIGNRIYHYTTMEAFYHLIESITESKDKNSFVFRATNLFFMNDPQEFLYGQKVLMEILERIERDKNVPDDKCLYDFFVRHKEKSIEQWNRTLLDSIEEQNEIPYAIAFSHHKDSLPMWLNYGNQGKGVCLAFPEYRANITGLGLSNPGKADIEIDGSMSTKEVFYQSNSIINQNNKKTWLYKDIENLYNKLYWGIVQKGNVNDWFSLQYAVIKALIIVECPCIKSIEYEGENECRIIRRLHQDYKGDMSELHFRCNNKGNIIPYVNVEIPVNMLDYVRIGPMADTELSKNTINMMKKSLD